LQRGRRGKKGFSDIPGNVSEQRLGELGAGQNWSWGGKPYPLKKTGGRGKKREGMGGKKKKKKKKRKTVEDGEKVFTPFLTAEREGGNCWLTQKTKRSGQSQSRGGVKGRRVRKRGC